MTEPQLISSDECLKILQAQNGRHLPINEIQLEQLTKNLGFLGEYYVLRIITEPVLLDGRYIHQSFIKTLPQKNLEYRADCERKGVLKKECGIYRKILPKLQRYAKCKLFADCYLARDDLLVLEDLSFKYRQLPAKEMFTMAHYRSILRHLATLHAAGIAWERDEHFSIGERYKDELFELLLSNKNDWYLTGVKAIIYLAAQHGQFQDSKSQSFIKNKLYGMLIQAEKLAQPSKKLRNVLCHRDLSKGNIFLSSASESCLFVDFGISTYSPPAIDIHFLLYINSTIERRRSIYKEVMDCYFNELQARFTVLGIPAGEISREDFQLDCRRGHLAGLIMSAICLPLFKMPEDFSKKLREKDSIKFDYWMNVERSELLELAMANDTAYKAEVLSIIAELVEYLKTDDSRKILDI
ncbi:uncharacterized protein LOC117779820 [Drosophila innubila]|uniref:uncharacterized protein LOC117779820 n=1 Tax=Drosophila innubila TaxID=198719 RepID=UPI00148BC508|nr:uncharacterized protein LOC117779820 [Drosophila innubila]